VTDFVYEIALAGERARRDAARAWFERDAGSAWQALPGLIAVDVYEPHGERTRDPFVDDGPGPLLMAMLQFSTLASLAQAVTDRAFAQYLSALPAGLAITGTALDRRFFAVAGADKPGPLTAPFSYVVRYHQPAKDAAHFVAHYLAGHPPLLAKLPQIRSVLCYLPIDAATAQVLPCADYMIGNEVAFDGAESFNAAMASPGRAELRAHFRAFPPFTGRTTHHAMSRRRLPVPPE
jgi:hypothetical protein